MVGNGGGGEGMVGDDEGGRDGREGGKDGKKWQGGGDGRK